MGGSVKKCFFDWEMQLDFVNFLCPFSSFSHWSLGLHHIRISIAMRNRITTNHPEGPKVENFQESPSGFKFSSEPISGLKFSSETDNFKRDGE